MTENSLLSARFERIATLNEAAAMLGWDAAAMMPPGGAPARGDQLAVLAGVTHQLLTEPAVAAALAAAEEPEDEWDRANLQLMRHAHSRATALPAALVEAQSRAGSSCEKIWRRARAESDFKLVLPAFEEVL